MGGRTKISKEEKEKEPGEYGENRESIATMSFNYISNTYTFKKDR